jgi:putative MFS transporter
MTDAPSPGRDQGMLRRMTWATAIGEGLDGFDLGIIAVVLTLITKDLGLTPVWSGLIAASTLVGIFFGSPVVGWLSDRIGRRTLFTVDIASFVVLGLLQAVVTEPWQLFVVRLLLGVAVGAEYALGAALLSEFAPSAGRGRRVAGLLVTWYMGYLLSVVVAYTLVDVVGLSWRCAGHERRPGPGDADRPDRPAGVAALADGARAGRRGAGHRRPLPRRRGLLPRGGGDR